ncbi:Transcription factor GATA-4 [Coemansia sp. S610]|nr:Transcription factor GATA-4 [Coemansia sp. S610]
MSQGQADSQQYYTTSGTYGDSQAASYQHYANSQVSPTTLMPYNSQPIPYHANTQPQFSSQLQMDSTTLAFTMGQQTVARVKRCSNCQTTETPTWRRHVKTQAQVCNACGLYYKLHGRDREFTLNSHGKKTVKRQPRGSGARAQRSRGFANTLELTSQAPVAHPHMVMTDVEYVSVTEYDMATQSTHRIPSPPNEYPGHTH